MPLLQWTTISRSGVELAEALRQLRQRDQRAAGNAADLKLLGVAHVEDEQVLAAVEPLLQFLDGDVSVRGGRRRRFLAADAAELLVVDQLRDGRVGRRTADTSGCGGP